MLIRLRRLVAVSATGAFLLLAPGVRAEEVLRVSGTGASLGTLRRLLGAFERANPGHRLQLLPSVGSSGAVAAVANGALDVGISARPLEPAEQALGLTALAYARTPLLFAVGPRTGVRGITTGELVRIYRGELKTWPNGERVRLVMRPRTDVDSALLRAISPEMAAAMDVAFTLEGLLLAVTNQECDEILSRTPGSNRPHVARRDHDRRPGSRPTDLERRGADPAEPRLGRISAREDAPRRVPRPALAARPAFPRVPGVSRGAAESSSRRAISPSRRCRRATAMADDTNLTRTVSLAARVLTAAVVVLPPTIYFAGSYQHAAGVLEAEAAINARLVTRIVSANPDLWAYEQVRLSEYLTRRTVKGEAERRRVLDARGAVVAESADPLPRPWLTRSVPLFDAGVRVGTMEVSGSLRPLLFRSGVLALALFAVGLLSYRAVRTVPLRAIERSQEALRRQKDTAQKYLDVAGVAFVIVDEAGHVTLVNRKGCENPRPLR